MALNKAIVGYPVRFGPRHNLADLNCRKRNALMGYSIGVTVSVGLWALIVWAGKELLVG